MLVGTVTCVNCEPPCVFKLFLKKFLFERIPFEEKGFCFLISVSIRNLSLHNELCLILILLQP